jgi:hypothetical protein
MGSRLPGATLLHAQDGPYRHGLLRFREMGADLASGRADPGRPAFGCLSFGSSAHPDPMPNSPAGRSF